MLKGKDINIIHSYTDPKKLKETNLSRRKLGKKNMKLAGYLGYVSREGAVKNNVSQFNSSLNLTDDKVREKIKSNGYLTRGAAIQKNKIFFNSINEEEESIIGLTSNGFLKINDQKALTPLIDDLNEKEEKERFNIQQGVITFSPDYTDKIKGKINQKEILKKFEKCLLRNVEEYGYDNSNLNYTMVFHTNEKHLHMHFTFWEKNEKKRFQKLDLTQNDKFKEQLAKIMNSLMKEKKYEEVDFNKNVITKLKEEVEPISQNLFDRCSLTTAKGVGFIKDEELKKDLLEYSKKIYDAAGYEDVLLDKLHWKIEDDKTKEDYYNRIYENEKERLIKDIANIIFKDIPRDYETIFSDNDIRFKYQQYRKKTKQEKVDEKKEFDKRREAEKKVWVVMNYSKHYSLFDVMKSAYKKEIMEEEKKAKERRRNG